jgi:N-methylhydantoinase A
MTRIGSPQGSYTDKLAAVFAALEAKALAEMTADGYSPETLTIQPALDMRYAGQSHELSISIPPGGYQVKAGLFHAAHNQRFGYEQPQETVEIVTARLTIVAQTQPPRIESEPLRPSRSSRAVIGRKEVWFNQKPVETSQYDRAKLAPGDTFSGPAVIYQYDTTTVIPPTWQVQVDAYRNLVVNAKRG